MKTSAEARSPDAPVRKEWGTLPSHGTDRRPPVCAGGSVILAAALLALSSASAATLKISPNSTTRAAGEVEANYSSTHLYIDEVAGESIPITIFFDPGTMGVESAEVFTNLNRRDRAGLDANSDGIEDGILGPNGNTIAAGNDGHYYKAYTMGLVSGGYQITLNASKTGACRLTARYRLNGDAPGAYRWYSDTDGGGKRDYAIVVSPKTARSMIMYELNAMNVEAEGTLESQRSTFVDLWDGPGSTRTPRWNLNHARGLGVNWLWFQPIHPFGIDGRHLSAADINARAPGSNATTRFASGSEDVNYPYAYGSPYAVKNFFEVEARMSKANARTAAMIEFQNFVNAADNGGTDTMNVMLDAPFNHSAWDVELAAKGVQYFSSGSAAADEIRNREARFFSRSGNYAMRAFDASSIAAAPDRGDFGKFLDTFDIYWGRYAALVATNPANNGDYLSEADWFDTSVGSEGSSGSGNGHFDAITRNVWRYFADYLLFWLDQTGCAAGTSLSDQVWKGLDGLRADFAQGMPPQGWEYLINKTRARKWTFVFMAESLDGGPVTYRSSRHFDVLNENVLFAIKGLSVGSNSMTSSYRSILEDRRTAYGQSMVLLNTTSHDEDNYSDPWEALIRYAVNSSVDGVPMLFNGQELGISTLFGFDLYEKNFGKYIPHFKTYNSMMPLWLDADYGNDQLYPVYAGIGGARAQSGALRSSNRYFLDQVSGGGTHQRIFSVAKFEARNASPVSSDVVFAFINLDRNASQTGAFNVNQDTDSNSVNDYGIKPGRAYNVRNIAAYTGIDPNRRNVLLWSGIGRTGSDILGNGIFVSLNPVPTTVGAWSAAPYEAQYLKLLDVTAPAGAPSQLAGLTNLFGYQIGNNLAVSWPPVPADSEGIAPHYGITVARSPVGGNVNDPGATFTSYQTVNPNFLVTAGEGMEVLVTVWAYNPNNPQSVSAGSASLQFRFLSASGDHDADGMSNQGEDVAGTNPLDRASSLRVASSSRPTATSFVLTWASVVGKTYRVQAATTPAEASFADISGDITATDTATSFTDTAATGARKFYRVRVVTP